MLDTFNNENLRTVKAELKSLNEKIDSKSKTKIIDNPLTSSTESVVILKIRKRFTKNSINI